MRGAMSPLHHNVFMVRCLVKHRDNFTQTHTHTHTLMAMLRLLFAELSFILLLVYTLHECESLILHLNIFVFCI
jgi:hypothetical protein